MTTAVKVKYQSGFGNHFSSEAEAGALPEGQNSPQKPPYGLYAEQLSGTAFTAARHENQRSWLYRIRPSVLHSPFKQLDQKLLRSRPFGEILPSPNQMRWNPLPVPQEPTDFVEGLITMAGNGGYASFKGAAAHIYVINKEMGRRFFYNADGDFLIVPESGELAIKTEFGDMDVAPGEICVIQKGIKYQINPAGKTARGYICENYGAPFKLPGLGPIGANGLANPRDFQTPSASYEEKEASFELVAKFQGGLWSAETGHSPMDVVAWHGNYAPYKYDLSKFQAVNTVNFDHSDPSIFTVLTSTSEFPGTANIDFVIFPPRWSVAENTFRPPYYHRNIMSEFMGLIRGIYDAKQTGFVPGGSSLHNAMSAHGPDKQTFEAASNEDLKPVYMKDTLAFMFESSLVFHPTRFASETEYLQTDYLSCWHGLGSNFKLK